MKVILVIGHFFLDLFYLVFPVRFFYGNKRNGFFFLTNTRNISDVYTNYKFLKIINESLLQWFLIHLWPIVVTKIHGLKNAKLETINGWFVGIFLTADEILKNKPLAIKKVLQAIRLAENYGLRVIGLGGYTSSIVNVREVNENFDIIITSGNSYTAIVSVESIVNILSDHGKNLEDVKIGIVGATGSVGRILTHLLFNRGAKYIKLVSKTLINLENFQAELSQKFKNVDISYSTNLMDLKNMDFIVLATNAPSALIQSGHLKEGAIVYDISQPKNVAKDIILSRSDCHFFDGGLVRLPKFIKYKFNFRLREGSIFGCMAETMIISITEFNKKQVKEGDDNYIELLRIAGFKLGFTPYYYELGNDGFSE